MSEVPHEPLVKSKIKHGTTACLKIEPLCPKPYSNIVIYIVYTARIRKDWLNPFEPPLESAAFVHDDAFHAHLVLIRRWTMTCYPWSIEPVA